MLSVDQIESAVEVKEQRQPERAEVERQPPRALGEWQTVTARWAIALNFRIRPWRTQQKTRP